MFSLQKPEVYGQKSPKGKGLGSALLPVRLPAPPAEPPAQAQASLFILWDAGRAWKVAPRRI